MQGHDDPDYWDSDSDEIERIERDAIADFRDATIRRIESEMWRADERYDTFSDDELAAAQRYLDDDPADTVAAVLHVFRVMEVYGVNIPRNAIIAELLGEIQPLFKTEPQPQRIFSSGFLRDSRTAIFSHLYRGTEVASDFDSFFKVHSAARNRVVHGSFTPDKDETQKMIEDAMKAVRGFKKMIGRPPDDDRDEDREDLPF